MSLSGSNNNTAIDAAQNSALRSEWFARLERTYQSIKEPSGLECATRCNARCCPKTKSSANTKDAVGHVAIMLPFELEYIVEKASSDRELIHETSIEFTDENVINIGFMTSEKPCPFLTKQNKCGIYDIRPIDCRSFPLIPVFSEQGSISFRKDQDCPSATTLSAAYEEELKVVWHELLSQLPMTYRRLYNAL